MEEQNNPTDSQPTGNVMDVTAPKLPTEAESVEVSTPDTEVAPAPSEASEEAAPEAVESSESEPIAPASDTSDTPNISDEASTPAQPPLSPVVTAPHKKRGPGLVVIIAILIGLGLAGAAVYMYLQHNKKASTSTAPTTTATQTEAPQTKGATTSDVDDATKEVDTTLTKSNDTKDFSSTSISDQSLGL